MLGRFSIEYDGHEIRTGKAKSKVMRLLEIIWLAGESGITRQSLLEALYDPGSDADEANSFNNLVYQMRSQLSRSGLPQSHYIVKHNGMYRSDPQTPITTDVWEFRDSVRAGDKATGAEERFRHYDNAIRLYKGALLPHLSDEAWVIRQGELLRNDYERITNWAAEYCREHREFDSMYRICSRAAELFPEREWQIGMVDALLFQGKYKEAFQLYDKTVTLYTVEQGREISDAMKSCARRMSEAIRHAPGEIYEIQKQLMKSAIAAESAGPYSCTYSGFVDCYHVLVRNMERTGYGCYLMLCTLVDYAGKPLTDPDKLSKRCEEFSEAVRQTLRQGDTFTRYGQNQYLILLVGTGRGDCELIYRRILHRLHMIAGSRAGFEYSVESADEVLRHPEQDGRPS